MPRESPTNVDLPQNILLDADPQQSHNATEEQRPQPDGDIEFAGVASISPKVADRRHPTLWFPDGSLTVVASDGVEFKLHPGLLAHHSEVLKQRIATVSSLVTPRVERGLAVYTHQEVTLNLPENGDDLGGFFGMMYDGNTQSVYYNLDTRITFAQFHRILRLGVKYKVQQIVKSGFARLELAFPQDFDTWCSSDKTWDEDACPIEMNSEDTIPLIILSRDAKYTSILPVMLYVCTSQVDSRCLLEGVSYASETYKLELADQITCVDARRRLQTIEAGTEKIFVRGASDGPTSQCTTRQACIAVCKHLVLEGEKDGVFHDGQPLEKWDGWIDVAEALSGEKRLCVGCKEHLKSEIKNHLRKEWERLGEIFNVPDWTPSRKQTGEANME